MPVRTKQSDFHRGWKRSLKGNLWREYDGKRISVFPCEDGYKWCIAYSKDERQYSRTVYDSEEEALEALKEELT
jgi:hypothetical protein